MVSAFLWAVVLVSLIELVAAFALVGSLRPFRRPGRNYSSVSQLQFSDRSQEVANEMGGNYAIELMVHSFPPFPVRHSGSEVGPRYYHLILIALMNEYHARLQLNLFLFSVLLSDLVMTLVVMPLHAIHAGAAVGVAGSLSCSSWMYAHLMAIAARLVDDSQT